MVTRRGRATGVGEAGEGKIDRTGWKTYLDVSRWRSKLAVARWRERYESSRLSRLDAARWRARGKLVLFAGVGALLAVALFGRVEARVGPFDTTVSARPAWSAETLVRLPPLGEIRLDTHTGPLALQLQVDQLGFDEAERIAEELEIIEALGDDVADEVTVAFRRLVLRCLVLALIGGALGALAARVHWRTALAGTATGGAVVVAILAGTVATFDTGAVGEPRYSGLLTMAPRAVGNVESVLDRYGEYRAQLSDLVGNMVTLYLAAEGLPTFDPTDSTTRILHVSDIHLNDRAFELMHDLVDQFDVDAIADTGDISDWGTSTENLFVEEIAEFDVPYLWVRGNHDSASTQRAVSEQPNAVVLDDDAETVAGLRFWGIGDPRYTPDREEVLTQDDQQVRAEEFALDVVDAVGEAQPPDIDVGMVHDPRVAAELGGEIPLVLAGHTHEPDEAQVGEDDETTVLVEGSTGGAGLRGVQDEAPTPFTATVLYFAPETNRLAAYDRISVTGLGGTGATIERHIIAENEEEDEDPASDGDSDEGEGSGDGGSDDPGGGGSDEGSDSDEGEGSGDGDGDDVGDADAPDAATDADGQSGQGSP